MHPVIVRHLRRVHRPGCRQAVALAAVLAVSFSLAGCRRDPVSPEFERSTASDTTTSQDATTGQNATTSQDTSTMNTTRATSSPATTSPATTSPPRPSPGEHPVRPAGTFAVVSTTGSIVDPSRDDRTIAYQVFAPADTDDAAPVIIVSHGGVGNPRGHFAGNHLGATFASGGFVAVHLAHDRSADGDRQVDDRPADVTFFLDELEAGRIVLPDGFNGSVDAEHVGHTGHSFGAYTSHAVGGATYARTYRDERIDAIAPISPQGPDQFGAFVNGRGDTTWTSVTIPAFNLIGGDEIDGNAVDSIQVPGWRLAPFDHYPGTGDTYRSIVAGAGHSDMWSSGADDVEAFIATEILDFMRRYVAGDESVDVCGIGVGELTTTSATIERRAADPTGELAACS